MKTFKYVSLYFRFEEYKIVNRYNSQHFIFLF